jgi:hypothetical protein
LALWDSGVTTGMRGLAGRLGLRYCANTGDRSYQADVGGLTLIGPLTDSDPTKQLADLMYGRYQDRNIELFNYSLGTYPEEPSHPTRSCALVTFTATFPRVTIGRHSRMTSLRLQANRRWLDFAPEEFRQRFHIEAPDNETARAILTDEMIHWLMSGRDDVRLTLEDTGLLGHVGRLDEDKEGEWESLVDYVVGFHGQIPAQAWVTYSVFGTFG